MKRFITVILATGILLSGCGGSSDETSSSTAAETEAVEADETEPEEDEVSDEDEESTDETAGVSCGDIYDKCVESGAFEELVPYDDDYMMNYFGIDTSTLADYAAAEALDAVKADALMILKADDETGAAELETTLNDYLTRKLAELENYNAEEFDKASDGIVGSSGSYAYVIICEDPSSVLSIIEEEI
ncbi:MAG: DUF4358 domain-containing protein [Clostridiales bacterium]|nr:DUF4358 domain-containing protein [Clostridiales bacterium]